MERFEKLNPYKELEKEKLKKTEGGLGALAIILAVGGITGFAFGYKSLCDEINGIGRNIGATWAK